MIQSALILTALAQGTATQPIEIPFRIADNAIIADAVINGRKVSCMFDTGFSGAFVLNDSINIGKPDGSITLRDFVGQFEATSVSIKTLQMGGKTVRPDDLSVVQQSMAHMSLGYNMHTDGIMGIEVMRDYILEINFQKSKFILHPKSFDISTRKGDNKRTFLIKMLPKGHNSVELPVVTPNGEMMVLALDTGNAFYATTHKDVLERVGLWTPGTEPKFMKTAFVASGPVDSWYYYMEDASIWGVPVKGSTWSIIDLPSSSSEHDGTIGFGFLKNFNIVIDKSRRRVWLDNFAGKVTDPPVAEAGINVFLDDDSKRYIITRVSPDSPAEKAGIKTGDHLLGVNGNELLDVGFRQVSAMLEGEQGSIVTLAVSRRGNLARYELKREYLINNIGKRTAEKPPATSGASSGQ